MPFKLFFATYYKKIFLSLLVALNLVLGGVWLFQDYQQTKQEANDKQTKITDFKAQIPLNLQAYIPEKGNDIITLYLEKDFVLNQNKDFRQAIYHALNRKNIQNNQKKFIPTAVLFTNDFFVNNPTLLPTSDFKYSESLTKILAANDLTTHGYNMTKALNYLQKAWDTLTPEQKNQNYVLKIKQPASDDFEAQVTFVNNVITDIKNLFQQFNTKHGYLVDKLTCVLEPNPMEANALLIKYQLTIPATNQEFINSVAATNPTLLKTLAEMKKKALYSIHNPSDQNHRGLYYLSSISKENPLNDNLTIKLNFDPLISYLVKINHQFTNLDFYTQINRTTKQYEDDITKFWSFYEKNIAPLIRTLSTEKDNDPELKPVITKTYEEIFNQTLCLAHQQYWYLPIGIIC